MVTLQPETGSGVKRQGVCRGVRAVWGLMRV